MTRHVEYTLENPHPGYGKDPNIINPLGHTEYPKFVPSKENPKERIIVNNEKEEAELGAPEEVSAPAKAAPKVQRAGWTK